MSLQIMLHQITLPSFFGMATTGQKSHSYNQQRSAHNAERRAEIIRILKREGTRVGYERLSEETGWTIFSLRNLINALEADGKIVRSRDNTGKAMVQVTKWA